MKKLFKWRFLEEFPSRNSTSHFSWPDRRLAHKRFQPVHAIVARLFRVSSQPLRARATMLRMGYDCFLQGPFLYIICRSSCHPSTFPHTTVTFYCDCVKIRPEFWRQKLAVASQHAPPYISLFTSDFFAKNNMTVVRHPQYFLRLKMY
jgi:hypothetical protein